MAAKSKALAKGFLPTPKKSAVSEAKAKKFEEASPEKNGKGSPLRREELGSRLTVYLPKDMTKQLKLACVEKEYSVSYAVTEAVGQWLK